MLENLPFPREAVCQVLLRLSLLFGSAIDASFAALLVLAPQLPARFLGLRLPAEPLFLWWLGLSFFLLAVLSLFPVYDYVAYSGNIAVAILGRLAGGGLVLLVALGRQDSMALYGVVALEIALAVVHLGLWSPIRRSAIL